MTGRDAVMYKIFQIVGGVIGSFPLWLILTCGVDVFATHNGANTYNDGVKLLGGLVAEIVFTCIFVLLVLGSTDTKKGAGNFAGLAIGL